MHSLKVTWSGRTLALAMPNDSGGKKSRIRIPKEERKAMMESFIKKHQRLNNGNFPSLSLTHREVGGSFYTVREIFREIIQENRVLGSAELIYVEKGANQEQNQSQSSSILMEPVAPLSLSPNGSPFALDQKHCMQETLVLVPNTCLSEAEAVKTLGNGENVNGSQEGLKDIESDILSCRELKASRLLDENAGLLAQNSFCSASETSKTLPGSCNENNVSEHDVGVQEKAEVLNGSFSAQHGERKLENGKNIHENHFDVEDKEIEQEICSESRATEPVEVDKTVKEAVKTNTVNMTESASGTTTTTTDMSASMFVETFPLTDSCNGQSSELESFSEGGNGMGTTGMTLEADTSSLNTVCLEEMTTATSVITGEKREEVTVDKMPYKTHDPLDKEVGENIINPATTNIECANTKDTVAINVLFSDANETKESSNGTLTAWTTEQNLPTSSNEQSGIAENDTLKNDGMSSIVGNGTVQETTMKEGKVDASDGSCSEKGSAATLNRIKPESWKGASNNDMAGRETNPFLAVLKSFLTAFVKFWSE